MLKYARRKKESNLNFIRQKIKITFDFSTESMKTRRRVDSLELVKEKISYRLRIIESYKE
jgi:hypothetical protein